MVASGCLLNCRSAVYSIKSGKGVLYTSMATRTRIALKWRLGEHAKDQLTEQLRKTFECIWSESGLGNACINEKFLDHPTPKVLTIISLDMLVLALFPQVSASSS